MTSSKVSSFGAACVCAADGVCVPFTVDGVASASSDFFAVSDDDNAADGAAEAFD